MAVYVALLRGINVGTAKHVSMADLGRVLENTGARDVETLLRSGNVVFAADTAPSADAIEAELLRVSGVQANVLVIAAEEFAAIAAENPLATVATDGSKLFVTFLSEPPANILEPDAAALAPEQLRLGRRAVYQWFPDGSLRTTVPKSWWSQFTGTITARNANTVERILKLL